MFRKTVACFIIILVSSKSCVTSYEFPALNFKSMLPNLRSSLITKPFQTLYQTPLSAINMLNPLNYLMSSSNYPENFNDDLNGSYSQNYTLKSPDQNKHTVVTKTPNIQDTIFSTSPYNKQKKLDHVTQNNFRSEIEVTPSSFIQSQKLPKYGLVELSPKNQITYFDNFMQLIEQLESKFYQVSFRKLLSISPSERQENGISFAQSSLFLYIQLMAICTESDAETVMEIKQSLGLQTTCAEQVQILNGILLTLPKSNEFLKFRWSSRLVLGPRVRTSEKLLEHTAPALHMHMEHLVKTEGAEELTKRLNQMVEADSGGAMHDTFEEDEISNGICAAWLTTIYLRARWRSAPTVLNSSWLFHDGNAPARSVRMIKINDVMRYVNLEEWEAEAIEIPYATPELTFMILIPRGRSLRNLAERISAENLHHVYEKMHTKRIAVILPIYTLRMTLLLPGKIEMMGISRLVDSQAGADCQSLKFSHAVQRIMFWAEAGRNAFKDDGLEWDEAPELQKVVDRPYIFFVRWRNITLLSGNFVL